MMSAPLQAMPAWNGAIASSSLRLNAPGGTEIWACASPPLALTVVWLDNSCVADDRLTPPSHAHRIAESLPDLARMADVVERIALHLSAASIAIPGVCVPVTMDGETYIDGGIADVGLRRE